MFPMNPHSLALDAADLTLVVIDMQERLTAAMEFKIREQAVANARRLLALANELNLPTVVTEQYPKGLGPTLAEIAAELPDGVTPLPKTVFSCCGEPAFEAAVKATGRKTLVVFGIETHVCVMQTVVDLLAEGYRVFVPQDACGSRTQANWRIGLNLMDRAGAVISSTETVIFQVLKAAGTPAFKAMQPWVK